MTDPREVKAAVQARARELGFADCRVAGIHRATHAAEFARWLADGCHGEMKWLERAPERRSDPRLVLEGAQAMLVLAVTYFKREPATTGAEGVRGRIARYAWGDDYHDVVERKLEELADFLATHGGRQKVYVDTGPVLERDFASDAGLGWNGKSTLQIHPKLGAWFFLAEVLTTLPLPPDEPFGDHCGKCTRCIVACPTQAITHPRRVDARRCLSYLTIENKGPIPEEFRRALGDRIYGCDDCLAACPWNRFAQESREAAFAAREFVAGWPLRQFLALDDEGFRALFRKSPIKRIKRPAFLRNVCVALGNVGTPDDVPALEAAARDPHPLVAEHAAWALSEIARRQ